jgi:Fe2+ or Zn2+ uptake regulation protein
MPELIDRLRDHGWRLTPQRRVVAEVLAGEHVHLTADEVYERARAALPEISLATVYNTLNELVAMGEVLEVNHAGDRRRYDPNVGELHEHLLCVGCGRILDVHAPRPQLDEAARHGFEIHDVDVVFRGRCPECSARGVTRT